MLTLDVAIDRLTRIILETIHELHYDAETLGDKVHHSNNIVGKLHLCAIAYETRCRLFYGLALLGFCVGCFRSLWCNTSLLCDVLRLGHGLLLLLRKHTLKHSKHLAKELKACIQCL